MANGKSYIEEIGQYKNNLREGTWLSYDYDEENNVTIKKMRTFKNDKKNGKYIFYIKGKIRDKGQYVNDLKEGVWKTYHVTGELESIGKYKNGKKEGLWKRYYMRSAINYWLCDNNFVTPEINDNEDPKYLSSIRTYTGGKENND